MRCGVAGSAPETWQPPPAPGADGGPPEQGYGIARDPVSGPDPAADNWGEAGDERTATRHGGPAGGREATMTVQDLKGWYRGLSRRGKWAFWIGLFLALKVLEAGLGGGGDAGQDARDAWAQRTAVETMEGLWADNVVYP
jgi:hypothetical protein